MPRNAKQQAIEMIQRLPQDASMEDVMRQLHLLTKVQRGVSQIEAGQVIEHDESKTTSGTLIGSTQKRRG
jgi:predicted transcriptional regulator